MRSASRASARRISTCCCCASGSRPTIAPASRSKPASATRRSNRVAQRPAVDEAGALRLGAEEDVLRHGQPRDEGDLLGDERDPAHERVARRPERDGLPAHDELALILREDTGDDLAERRLPGAVLADERVDRAGMDGDRDIVEGARRPEGLAERAHLEMDGAVRRAVHGVSPIGVGLSPATPRAAGRCPRWPSSRRRRPAARRAGRHRLTGVPDRIASIRAFVPCPPSVAGICMTVPKRSPDLMPWRAIAPPPYPTSRTLSLMSLTAWTAPVMAWSALTMTETSGCAATMSCAALRPSAVV